LPALTAAPTCRKAKKAPFATRLNRYPKQLLKANAKAESQSPSMKHLIVTPRIGSSAKAARNLRLVIFDVRNLGALRACQCFAAN
jgi:hypothetical protein